MKYFRLILFLAVALLFLPDFSPAKEAPKEAPAVQKKETAPIQREPVYTPNENDIKSFVYRWFSWLDHQVADFLLLYHISKDDLVMKFPETVVRNHSDFKIWYQGVKDNIQSNNYEVSDIKVTQLPKGRYKVELLLRWKAKTYKGETLDMKFKQSWILSLSGSGRLTINRYVVSKTK
jgi:hypothetical protein